MSLSLTRHDWDMLRERVSKLESQIRALEEKQKIIDNRYKGENLLRLIREAEEHERMKKERKDVL